MHVRGLKNTWPMPLVYLLAWCWSTYGVPIGIGHYRRKGIVSGGQGYFIHNYSKATKAIFQKRSMAHPPFFPAPMALHCQSLAVAHV